MTVHDAIIRKNGIPVTVYQITSAVYDDYDNLDWDASTKTTIETHMLPNEPTNTSFKQKQTGWSDRDEFEADFPSDVDVPAGQGVEADVVVDEDGNRYRIQGYDPRTKFMGLRRRKLLVSPLGGNQTG